MAVAQCQVTEGVTDSLPTVLSPAHLDETFHLRHLLALAAQSMTAGTRRMLQWGILVLTERNSTGRAKRCHDDERWGHAWALPLTVGAFS